MNSRTCNCTSSNDWHQDQLEGCHDIVNRLAHVIDILKSSHAIDIAGTRRLRLVLGTDETNANGHPFISRGIMAGDFSG